MAKISRRSLLALGAASLVMGCAGGDPRGGVPQVNSQFQSASSIDGFFDVAAQRGLAPNQFAQSIGWNMPAVRKALGDADRFHPDAAIRIIETRGPFGQKFGFVADRGSVFPKGSVDTDNIVTGPEFAYERPGDSFVNARNHGLQRVENIQVVGTLRGPVRR